MNRLNKIFLVIIFVLLIIIACLTYECINLRNQSKENLNETLKNAQELYQAENKIRELEQKLGY